MKTCPIKLPQKLPSTDYPRGCAERNAPFFRVPFGPPLLAASIKKRLREIQADVMRNSQAGLCQVREYRAMLRLNGNAVCKI